MLLFFLCLHRTAVLRNAYFLRIDASPIEKKAQVSTKTGHLGFFVFVLFAPPSNAPILRAWMS
jgi:hypothetical protein